MTLAQKKNHLDNVNVQSLYCFLRFENIKKKLCLSYIVGARFVSYIRQDRPTVELIIEDLLSQKLCIIGPERETASLRLRRFYDINIQSSSHQVRRCMHQ